MSGGVNFIGGQPTPPSTGGEFLRLNPADQREEIARHARSTAADVERAVEVAADAVASWRAVPGPNRASILHRCATLLEEDAEAAAREITLEEGKTLAEARQEVTRALNALRFFAEQARSFGGETADSEEEGTLIMTLRRPLGVVALITPWNFPLAIPTWKTAPAIAFGNAVVLKPASLAPGPALRLAKLFHRAGLPAGVLNVVVGNGDGVGSVLVDHPMVRGVSFTGSTKVGKNLQVRLAQRNVPYQAEMGGHSPVTVLSDADLDIAARIVADGAFLSAGQKCTATRRVIVEQSAYDSFVDRLAQVSSGLKIGNGLDPDVRISPMVGISQRDAVLESVATASASGARAISGGKAPEAPSGLRHGAFLEPTVLVDVEPSMTIAQEEVFGPVCSVFRARSFDHAIELANGVRYGLSAGVITRDLHRAFEFIRMVDSGMIHINRQTAGADPHMPFGGLKDSSAGAREQGRAARDFFSEEQTVYLHS